MPPPGSPPGTWVDGSGNIHYPNPYPTEGASDVPGYEGNIYTNPNPTAGGQGQTAPNTTRNFLSRDEIMAMYANRGYANPSEEDIYRAMVMPRGVVTSWMDAYYPPGGQGVPEGSTAAWGFNNSSYYQGLFERYFAIQSMAQNLFGHELTAEQVAEFARNKISDDQILYHWRQTDEYKQIFAEKPAYMTEADFRQVLNKIQTEGAATKEAFQNYGGRAISDQELRQIYAGGPGTDTIRQEYTQVMGMKASADAARGKLSGSPVKDTYLGPTQPLLGIGINAGASTGQPTSFDFTAPSYTQVTPSLTSAPPTEKWLTYSDYQQGRVNPNYVQRLDTDQKPS